MRTTHVALLVGIAAVARPLEGTAQSIDRGRATTPSDATTTSAATATSPQDETDWLHRWMRTVDEARASQPHTPAPLVTTHVLLVEQYRYDMSWQRDTSTGMTTGNYGASRGLEVIPTTRLELSVSPPPYLSHELAGAPNGFGDLAFQVKYRVASAPENQGSYFVGVFLAGSVPTGGSPNGVGHSIFAPTLAAAKGLGPVDVQSTIAVALPASGAEVLGRSILFNTAVQYQICGIMWPMVEVNSTFWSGGLQAGKREVFLTPGIVFGTFPLVDRLHLSVGAGVQIAVSDFHRYDHRWIASVRLPF